MNVYKIFVLKEREKFVLLKILYIKNYVRYYITEAIPTTRKKLMDFWTSLFTLSSYFFVAVEQNFGDSVDLL